MKKFIAFLFVNELKTKYSAGEEVTKFEQKGHTNPQQVERTAAAANRRWDKIRRGNVPRRDGDNYTKCKFCIIKGRKTEIFISYAKSASASNTAMVYGSNNYNTFFQTLFFVQFIQKSIDTSVHINKFFFFFIYYFLFISNNVIIVSIENG